MLKAGIFAGSMDPVTEGHTWAIQEGGMRTAATPPLSRPAIAAPAGASSAMRS
jgi:nicotinic acid mononucleotide adenylyltransferase